VNELASKVAGLDGAMATAGAYNQVCSQDLTGANGAAVFFSSAPTRSRKPKQPAPVPEEGGARRLVFCPM
jgi:hypothetical protein